MRFAFAALIVLLSAVDAYAAGWPARRAWSDKVAPADQDSPTYAEAYPAFVRETGPAWIAAGTQLDCADFSITLLCEYAARHELPLSFRHYSPVGAGIVATSAQSSSFATKGEYAKYIRTWTNALMLATLNNRAIQYDAWASGDHAFMDWNQSDVEPNYPGRTVWHTYVIGIPDVALFYGSINDGIPTPLVESRDPEHLTRVRESPDRYSAGPRRWNHLDFRRGFEVPPGGIIAADETRYATVDRLPVRRGPGTARAADLRLDRGTRVRVTGRWRDFARVEAPRPGRPALVGFVAETFLAAAAPTGPESFARVTVSSANVRLGPGLTHAIVERLAAPARVKVLARSGTWTRVATPSTLENPDHERWISTSLLRDEPAAPASNPMGTVTAASLNVRSGPGTTYAVVTTVAAGRRLEILEERSGWLRVRWTGAPTVPALWCSAAYVRRD